MNTENVIKVGFVQMNPVFGEKGKNIEQSLSTIEKLNAKLIVLPELFNTGYLFTSKEEVLTLAEEIPAGKTTMTLIDMARRKIAYIIAGIAEQEDGHCYNSAVLIGPQGFIAKYRKLHLFNTETFWFDPGNDAPEVFDIGFARIGIMICFDWFFPEVTRYLAFKGADIICHPANLVLPYCPQAMITRCIENRVFAITANRIGTEIRSGKTLSFIGQSQIVGTRGEVLYRASSDTEESRVVEIKPSDARDKQITPVNHIFHDRRIAFPI